jgi:hypothetical protein
LCVEGGRFLLIVGELGGEAGDGGVLAAAGFLKFSNLLLLLLDPV